MIQQSSDSAYPNSETLEVVVARKCFRLIAASAALLFLNSNAGAQVAAELGVPPQQGSGITRAQTAAPSPFSTFADFGWTYQKDKRPGVFTKDHIWQGTAGIRALVLPSLTLGAGVSYTYIDRKYGTGAGGSEESNGVTGFGTATIGLIGPLSLDLTAGYGGSHIQRTLYIPVGNGDIVASRADPRTRSGFVSARLSSTHFFDDLLIRPYVQYLIAETDTGKYTVLTPGLAAYGFGIANSVRSTKETLGRGALGVELSYPFLIGDMLIAPTVQAAVLHDFNLIKGYRDRTAYELSGGFNVISGDLTVGIRANAVVGRDDYSSRGGRMFVSYQF